MTSEQVGEFSALYERAVDQMVRVVALVSCEPVQAEDAVAEVFARAWSRWPMIRFLDRPEAWVMQVALNECRTRYRHRQAAQRNGHKVAQSPAVGGPDPTAGLVRGSVRRPMDRRTDRAGRIRCIRRWL